MKRWNAVRGDASGIIGALLPQIKRYLLPVWTAVQKSNPVPADVLPNGPASVASTVNRCTARPIFAAQEDVTTIPKSQREQNQHAFRSRLETLFINRRCFIGAGSGFIGVTAGTADVRS
ncbi:hypothetical protein KCP71_14970 [Salmonella enterica subsp. enterica]|nr:hypothetical protein KCP71_14970 [Salmonella enterica subsp. enterica]